MGKTNLIPTFAVMVVDDDENVLNSLYRLLKKEGYKIILAKSGEEALQKLVIEPVDLIISDQQMPGITGLELMKTVKEKFPFTMRIILTGKVDISTVLNAINEGEIYRFLIKPWNNEDIKINIRCALEKMSLEKENIILNLKLKENCDTLCVLEKKYPGITKIKKDSEGAVIID